MARPKTSMEDKRNQAHELYLNTDKTYKDIALIVGVSNDTVGRWVDEKGWRTEKAARSVTKEKVIANNLMQILNLQEEINKRVNKWPSASESDTITKLTKVIDTLSGKVSLPLYIESLSHFLKFLQEADPEMCKRVVDYSNAFIQSKARELA